MKECKEQDFEFKKLKTNGGGLNVDFSYSYAVKKEVHTNVVPLESTSPPHPELTNLLDKLKPVIADIFMFNFPRELCMINEFEATTEQSRYLERYYIEQIKKIDITGIAVSGSEEKKKVVITATYENKMGVTAINSKPISLSGSKYGFEEDVENIVNELISEAYLYVFKGKSAEPQLFSQEEQSGSTEGEEVKKKAKSKKEDVAA